MQKDQSEQSNSTQAGVSEQDEKLRKQIYELLEAQPELDTSKLEIRVENGEAVLVGVVRNEEERNLVEDLTASVQGITDVQDALDVLSRTSDDVDSSADRGMSRGQDEVGAQEAAP